MKKMTTESAELQIWNNATFDDRDSTLTSWSNLPPDFINESFDSESSKENQIPTSLKSSVSFTTNDSLKPPTSKTVKFADDRDIDAEIEQVEKEIGRLTNRLESLRLEKAEQTARSVAIRGRIVHSKIMESRKQTVKLNESKSRSSSNTRRGVSLGPGEIYSASVTPAQNRRKSCFFKLPGIQEAKPRGRSLSPRSRKAAASVKKAAATTVGSKRPVKKEESLFSSIQPKKLFNEEEKRKPLKPGRVVASRYSLISKPQTAERKRSFPENNHQRSEKRRASDENGSKSQGRAKKRWEIPSQVDVCCNDHETPIGKQLPKIRTLRHAGESPRDSGAAKRVAELEGKDTSFEFRQLLRFEE